MYEINVYATIEKVLKFLSVRRTYFLNPFSICQLEDGPSGTWLRVSIMLAIIARNTVH
jgi:hypothetical protein